VQLLYTLSGKNTSEKRGIACFIYTGSWLSHPQLSEIILAKYCLLLIIALSVLTGIVIGVNWIVDPFDVYRVVRKEGFNACKPTYEHYARLAKIIQVEKYPKPGLALGSSRTQYGIDMSHPLWEGKDGWNLAVNGANMYVVRRFFEHAAAVAPLKKVVIGLDFYMFNSYKYQGLDDDSYLAIDKTGHLNRWRWLRQYVLTLGSGSAFFASVTTLRKQKAIDSEYAMDGRMLTSRERRKILKGAGYNQKFLKIEKEFALANWTSCANNAFTYDNAQGINMMSEYRNIIDLANRKKIKLYLIISPIHARLVETLYGVGLGAKFEQWKRDITFIVDQMNLQNGNANIELWDFSTYSAYTTEEVPVATDRKTVMRWYLDPSHYSVELGNIMLNRLRGERSSTPFGDRLHSSSIDKVLEKQRIARDEFHRFNPEITTLLLDNALKHLKIRKENGMHCTNHLAIHSAGASTLGTSVR
jgi:hypothetical protein